MVAVDARFLEVGGGGERRGRRGGAFLVEGRCGPLLGEKIEKFLCFKAGIRFLATAGLILTGGVLLWEKGRFGVLYLLVRCGLVFGESAIFLIGVGEAGGVRLEGGGHADPGGSI
jgi:hypothetical protein